MYYDSLGLQITDKCNMACPHCITDASPAGKKVMRVEDIKAWIAAAKGFFNNICITGGEPLLFPDLVKQTLECINLNGFTSSLVSNCFWVHHPSLYKNTIRMLNECKLTKLAVSYDEFHDNRIFDIDDLVRLLSDEERRFSIVVQPCYLSENELRDKKNNLESLCQQYDCAFEPAVVVPFGRAKTLIPKASVISQVSMPCDVVRLPMIRYDGVFSACCGPALGSPSFSPLIYQNADRNVFEKGKNNLITNALYLYGSRYLFDKLPIELKGIVESSRHINTACGLCRAMLDNKEIVNYLYDVLENEKWIILCSSIQNGGVD